MSYTMPDLKTKEAIVVINASNEDYNLDIYDYLDFDSYIDSLNDIEIKKCDFCNKVITARTGKIFISC